jgi:hypothetical protein
MDHLEAVRLKAVEKYALGELPLDLREQFEEHYFDCSECANDLKALVTFMSAGRMVFEKEAPAVAPSRESKPKWTGWFSWLRPAIAVPALAALAAVIVFQNLVTIPDLKGRIPGATAQVYQSSYRVQGTTRGDSGSTITVEPNRSFALDFDFTPAKSFQNYQGKLLNPSGQTIMTFDLSSDEADKELHLVLPPGKVSAGKYDLVIAGGNGSSGTEGKNEVQRLSFVIEFRHI